MAACPVLGGALAGGEAVPPGLALASGLASGLWAGSLLADGSAGLDDAAEAPGVPAPPLAPPAASEGTAGRIGCAVNAPTTKAPVPSRSRPKSAATRNLEMPEPGGEPLAATLGRRRGTA